MLQLKCMKMRQMRGNLSLLALGFFMFVLVFCVAVHHHSVNAAAENNRPDSGNTENADGTHYITIYDDGELRNVRSDANTVREALLRAEIQLNTGDKVEPALDEEITANNFNINIYRARKVLVLDGKRKYRVMTASTTPVDIVNDAGVEMLEADTAKLVPYNNLLESGDTVAFKVIRAKTVHLNYYGKKLDVRTQADTVQDFLKEREIDTNTEKNWVSVALDKKITNGMKFSIQPQGKQTITIDEEIKFKEMVTYDYSIDYGKREVTQAGKNGLRTVTYEVNMKNGKELSRKLISSIVTRKAVNQQVKVGMKTNLPEGSHKDWMIAAGIPADQFGYVNYIITRESHWNPLAKNRSSGATGVCQALPGKKMASAGADWATNPITQLKWCNGYAVGRYGSWQKAYEFWTKNHWW